jgi:hypothetical protein
MQESTLTPHDRVDFNLRSETKNLASEDKFLVPDGRILSYQPPAYVAWRV